MNKQVLIGLSTLSLVTILSGVALSSSNSFAASASTATAAVKIPAACTFSGGGTYTATIPNGTSAEIAGSTLTVTCNDAGGFAIYAIGNSGDEYGNNNMIGNSTNIATGTSGTDSYWAMKITPTTGNTPTIENSFNSFHTVPSTQTKVASYLSSTGSGSLSVNATYKAYISNTQLAGTYIGKVKYTMVHPNTAPVPTPPPAPSAECNTPVPNLTYMQDLNSSNKATVLSSMTEDNQYYLRDKRDEKPYCVALLKDGNIWMTQNLDHDIKTDGTVIYDSTTTDIPSTWTPSTATYPTGTTTWNYSTTTPESYDPGALYWSGTPGDSTPVSTGDSHYHLGNYYNWTAAVAMNDSSSYTTDQQDANQSICPANWTLPKSGNVTTSGSFQYLVTQYGWDSSSRTMTNPNIWNSPIKAFLSGYWYGSLDYVGEYGRFWSPLVSGSSSSYSLYAFYDGYVGPGRHLRRDFGVSVRCLAR